MPRPTWHIGDASLMMWGAAAFRIKDGGSPAAGRVAVGTEPVPEIAIDEPRQLR